MLYPYILLAFLLYKILYIYVTPRKLILKSVIFAYINKTIILKVCYIQVTSLFRVIKNNADNKYTLLSVNQKGNCNMHYY